MKTRSKSKCHVDLCELILTFKVNEENMCGHFDKLNISFDV